ncbi:uncharacterized protein N7483_002707 [Penicillium malachiteum]|uniref:uncharacterized protein n=1 Tax=Penicillium malachiteum TaxID=1324776 RepID=UPI002548D761|nr:uncharacterized protein N7483_002707 [Penicillium malachiteum]KAJ5737582.1 hypothetical protein N7483_002707 [Penicillium malachiteum]
MAKETPSLPHSDTAGQNLATHEAGPSFMAEMLIIRELLDDTHDRLGRLESYQQKRNPMDEGDIRADTIMLNECKFGRTSIEWQSLEKLLWPNPKWNGASWDADILFRHAEETFKVEQITKRGESIIGLLREERYEEAEEPRQSFWL